MKIKEDIKLIHENTLGEGVRFSVRLARWEEDETEEAEGHTQSVASLSEASRVVRRYISDLQRPNTWSGGEVFSVTDDGEDKEVFAYVKADGTVWGAGEADWNGVYSEDPHVQYVLAEHADELNAPRQRLDG